MSEDAITVLIHGLGDLFSRIETNKAEGAYPKPEIMETDPLKHAIIDMMTENTGCHICDSGGAYGRAWQRNRLIKDWDKLEEVKVEAYSDEFYCTISLYHFLQEFIDVTDESKEQEKKFMEFSLSEENKDKSWIACMEEFGEKYFDSVESVSNTYNFDNLLDHNIQYTIVERDDLDSPLIILQVHLGCDARGGYTDPRIFSLEDYDYFCMAMTDLSACCNKCGMTWDSYDSGYNWDYVDGTRKNEKLTDDVDEEFKTIVDEEKQVRHKNCKGKIEFYAQLCH